MVTVANSHGIKLKYETVDDSADARAIFTSAIGMISLVEAVSVDLNPLAKLNVTVKSPERGSVIIGLEFLPSIVQHLQMLLPAADVTYVTKVSGAVTTVVLLIKALKGQKAAATTVINNFVVNVTLPNGENIQTDVDSLRRVGKGDVSEAVKEIFEPLAGTETISRFSLLELDDTPITQFDQVEFQALSTGTESANEEVETVMKRMTLPVVKPSYDRTLTWMFRVGSHNLSMKMMDKEFIDKVDRGYVPPKGDSLDADVRFKRVRSGASALPVEKDFEVVKVHTVIGETLTESNQAGGGPVDAS